MLREVIQDLIVCAVSSGIMYMARKLLKYFATPAPHPQPKPPHRKSLLKQFYWSVALFPVLLMAGVLLPILPGSLSLAMVFIKVCCFICAFFSFVFVCGAFDAAMSFYPSQDSVQVPPDNSPRHRTDDQR